MKYIGNSLVLFWTIPICQIFTYPVMTVKLQLKQSIFFSISFLFKKGNRMIPDFKKKT